MLCVYYKVAESLNSDTCVTSTVMGRNPSQPARWGGLKQTEYEMGSLQFQFEPRVSVK